MNNADAAEQYIDLLIRAVLGLIYEDGSVVCGTHGDFNETQRLEGKDWPKFAHSMVGMKRMENIRDCVMDVVSNGVPGDFIETGVWRGGSCIVMRGILKALGVKNRTVWVADSFAGLPPPDTATYPDDAGLEFHTMAELAVTLEQVQANFQKYGLLDGQVKFLKGWFRDTLPTAPIASLAILRLDGDLYESTMDGLVHLYPKLSVGGWVIVDDYGCVPACAKAVTDFRQSRGIEDSIREIDWTGVCWRRSK